MKASYQCAAILLVVNARDLEDTTKDNESIL